MKMKIISVFVVVFILLGASVVLACYTSSDCGRLKTCVGGSSPEPKYDPIYDDCGGSSGSCLFGTCKGYTAPVEKEEGTCSGDGSSCEGYCDDYYTDSDCTSDGCPTSAQTCEGYIAPVEEVLGTCSEPSGFKQNGYTEGVVGVCVNKANEIIDWFKEDGFRPTWKEGGPGIRYKKTF